MEVIIAMVIILIVFVIATGIYTNVIRSSPSVKQQQGRALTLSLIEESKQRGDWADQVLTVDSITLKKAVVPYQDYPDLWLIQVTATEQGKEIGMSRQIIKRTADETH